MKANLVAVLALLFIAFHVGAEALKCYEDETEDGTRTEVTCQEGEQRCLLRKLDNPPKAFGCADKEHTEVCRKKPILCTTCDTDLCNTLKCYNSEDKKPIVCKFGESGQGDVCIRDRRTDERKCGRCKGRSRDECTECNDEMCNGPPLKCYDSANKEIQCEDVLDEDGSGRHKCVTIVDGELVTKKCDRCLNIFLKGNETCEECNSDKCNDLHALTCYDATNQLNKCAKIHDKCITIADKVLNRVVDKKCGICPKKKPKVNFRQQTESESEDCEECNSDGCNNQPVEYLSCYNATGQLNKCESSYYTCITIKDRERVVDKKCGTCLKQQEHEREVNFDQLTESEDETSCKACNSDGCNKDSVVIPLECQNNNNKVEKCTDARHYCYTKKRNVTNWDGHWNLLVEEKGCGKCNGSSTTATHEEEVFIEGVINCTHCFRNECNSEKLEDKLDCYDEKSKDGSAKPCHAGQKCVVAYTQMEGNWALHQHCGLCPTNPPKFGFCKQCNSSKCNVYEYPKCKAGAGNGAGDFFVDKKCTEKLYLNKDENITATCIKQQVEGITYKDCSSCGAFVDYQVTKIPNIPKDLNINKCHECVSTEGAEYPCNGAILAHHLPLPFWLLLMIGAGIPWLMLYRAVPFTNV